MDNYLVLILCKNLSKRVAELEKNFKDNHINCLTICDICTSESDEYLIKKGFYNLTRGEYIKKPSAWDKSFYTILEQNLLSVYDYFFFIEDDVYSKNYDYLNKFIFECNINFNTDLITQKIKQKSDSPHWKYWKEKYIDYLEYPSQSFNPICRLSKKLIGYILNYQKINNIFQFHEILIPSLCLENNLSYTNYLNSLTLKQYIGRIAYNPILLPEDIDDNLIYHPVKLSRTDRKNCSFA